MFSFYVTLFFCSTTFLGEIFILNPAHVFRTRPWSSDPPGLPYVLLSTSTSWYINIFFYTSHILTAGLLFVAEYVHSFVLELLLSQLLKDPGLNGQHKNTSHHLNHTWLEDSESGWYLDCDWWFRSPQEQEHKYGRENCNKVLQSLHVFWTDCDKKSNLPSNHLVIRLTRQHQIITGTLEENRAGFISLWQLWKRPVAVTEGKLIQGRRLVVKNDTKSISTKVNSPHLSLLSLYILTSLSIPPRVTVPSSWDVSRGRRKRHEEREAKTTGI